MEYIRKVSVGSDYKSSMNYIVGQPVLRTYNIHVIRKSQDGEIQVYIENKKSEVFLWKSFSIAMPTSLEYNVNY
jgi:hypothetical protein|tara:strand:- start:252 stop:473 length:222 start_codon:yes stop_codon:yes gene_type:complete